MQSLAWDKHPPRQVKRRWETQTLIRGTNSAFDGSAVLELARFASGPLPGAIEVVQPTGFLTKRDHQQAHREPVPIAGALHEALGAVFEIPAHVLDLPLVGTYLPAPIDDIGNGRRTFGVPAHCCTPWTRQSPIQQHPGMPRSLSRIGRAHVRARVCRKAVCQIA